MQNQEKRYDELYNPPFFELKILYACICSSISIHLFFNSNLKKKRGVRYKKKMNKFGQNIYKK